MALKQFLEASLPSPDSFRKHAPRPSQILDALQFMKELSAEITLPRPKSRAFLDHLESVARDFTQSQPENPNSSCLRNSDGTNLVWSN